MKLVDELAVNDKHRSPIPVTVLLSIAGSIASLVGLAYVFIDKLAQSREADPQLAIWRAIFATIAFISIGALITFAVYHVRNTLSSSLTIGKKLLKATAIAIVALLAIGVCADALSASLYWRRLWSVDKLLRAAVPLDSGNSNPFRGPGDAISPETISRLATNDKSILLGTEVQASLTSDSTRVEEFNLSIWSLKGECNKFFPGPGPAAIGFSSYTIELRSIQFQPFITVSDSSSSNGLLSSLVDPTGNTARVQVLQSRLENVRIAVTSGSPNQTGAFTLRARCGL